ncbi:MAG: hypothetical protein PHG69_01570, partial [Candidatus Omnitrophica bacterium]|nr:hypothetical protein [Candidatus Omnitrophota bacterium]
DTKNAGKQPNSILVAIDNINLSQDIKDDSEILGIIPGCFKDGDCVKPGYVSKCEDASTKKARCVFDKIKTVKLTIVKPKVCKTCDVDAAIGRIKTILPELELNYLTEDDPAAKKIIEDAGIKMLPAYLIDSSADEEIIAMVGPAADKKGGYNVFSPAFTGVSYFVNREKIPNRLDVFFDVKTPGMIKILDTLEALKNKKPDIDIRLNFLAIEDPKEGIISKNGKYEEEEFIRSACINKYYPEMLWHYLSCRLSAIDSSWWDDCTIKFGMDSAKIKTCAQSEEGKMLLKEMIKLTQELEVVFGPTFLINNQEVLSSQGAPSEEELEKLFE